MLSSKEGQSVALGIAMLTVLTAATVHLHSWAQAQHVTESQMDVRAMMAHVGRPPVETAPSP
jgi:DNA invertase Pin-like site-specific DNA recombinase